MTSVSWSGVLGGTVGTASALGFAMGFLLLSLLAATAFALVLGAERRPRRRGPAIALRFPPDDRAAAA